MTPTTPRHHPLCGAILAALALTAAGAAAAQEPRPDGEAETTTLDRIEVTGSRIRSAEMETAQPITTISREDIQGQGFTSVADILQNLTSSGSPAISRSMALSSGEDVGGYFIDLRNLGAQRTLILVNGKRLGVSTSGLQDLGQIPVSAIERIEVLKDGASSIYGSDAIAGVVNVITRRSFDGAEANAYFGNYDQGDGTKESYDVTIGATTDRTSVTFSAEYSKEDPVSAADREFSKYGNAGKDFPFSGWSLISHNGVWLGNTDGESFTPPNCPSGLCTLNPGSDPRDPDNYHDITPAERANPNTQMYLATGIERRSIFVTGTIDITDDTRFRGEIGYNNRVTQQQIAGYPMNYGYGLLSADSYFNPAPEAGDLEYFRRFWEMPRRTRNELDSLRVSLGLEGSLNFGEKYWDWDVGFLSNRNTNNKYSRGDGYLPTLQAALGPSYFNESTGRVECGSAGSPLDYGTNFSIGECIPWNPLLPFGQAGEGSLANPDLQSYLFPEYHDSGRTETTVYSANVAGSLATLPAGELGLAFGIEHRREEGRFVPDAVTQTGQSTGLTAQITEGKYDLSEAYVELEVPVLADAPLAEELSFNVATRYSDYSNFGDTLNSKFSMRWRPIEGMLVRATYAEGFRAPSINDLYGGPGSTFAFYTDPCSAGQAGAGNAACNADVAPGFVQLGQGNVPCTAFPCQTNTPFLAGSNPDLVAEEAKSRTVGIVWSPHWADGLDLSLDWFNATIDSAIVAESATTILENCYLDGVQSSCDRISRGGNGVVNGVDLSLLNVGSIETEGYDLGVNYRLPETAIGTFKVNWQTVYTGKYDTRADQEPGTPTFGNVGFPGFFRVRSNLGVTWNKSAYTLSYMGRYYSGMKEDCATPVGSRPCSDPDHLSVQGTPDPLNRTGSNLFHDLQLAIALPWEATASLGANNITDHLGPIMITQPNSNFPYYGGFDIGRFWYVRYQQRF